MEEENTRHLKWEGAYIVQTCKDWGVVVVVVVVELPSGLFLGEDRRTYWVWWAMMLTMGRDNT